MNKMIDLKNLGLTAALDVSSQPSHQRPSPSPSSWSWTTLISFNLFAVSE